MGTEHDASGSMRRRGQMPRDQTPKLGVRAIRDGARSDREATGERGEGV